MTRYRTGPADASFPRPADPPMAATLADACMVASRAADGRLFACARPMGHGKAPTFDGTHYGMDRTGPVRLGYGR